MSDSQLDSWKITLPCTRAEAEALAEDNLFLASADAVPTIVTREVDSEEPDIWAIDVYCDQEPNRNFLKNISRLAPSTRSKPTVEKLGDQDWVTLSQRDLEPLRAGRFYVHTSHSAPMDRPRIRNICIDASQAFGTGHHETTLGCLQTLDQLKRRGKAFANIIDVGTGTGLLAFAANHLWNHAKIVASDIDPVAVDVTRGNATTNNIPLGNLRGKVQLLVSNGMDHPAIHRHAPYDLIIANILAGPLVMLAPQIAASAHIGTTLILAGLLTEQRSDVVSAYTKAGFRLRSIRLENEWPCLTFVKVRKYGRTPTRRRTKSPLAEDYFGEC